MCGAVLAAWAEGREKEIYGNFRHDLWRARTLYSWPDFLWEFSHAREFDDKRRQWGELSARARGLLLIRVRRYSAACNRIFARGLQSAREIVS